MWKYNGTASLLEQSLFHLVNLARKMILVANYDVITGTYCSEVLIGFCTGSTWIFFYKLFNFLSSFI